MKRQIAIAVYGALIAFSIVGVVLYFTWPTIARRTIASIKQEATAQNLLQSFVDSLKF